MPPRMGLDVYCIEYRSIIISLVPRPGLGTRLLLLNIQCIKVYYDY
jgi:hypothetical protein